jgi:Ca-activated chloride channel family protein
MTLLYPGFLWLLVVLPLVWIFPRGRRDVVHVALRTLVLALVVLALARPVKVGVDESEHQVFVVDLSASVSGTATQERLASVAAISRALPGSSTSTLVTFGAEPATLAPEIASAFDGTHTIVGGANSSPIAGALAAAATHIPTGSRGAITLISDGRATARRWDRVALELEERGVPVHVLALPVTTGDVYPVRITPLQPLRVGHGARLGVLINGEGATCDLHLTGPAGELASLEGLELTGSTSCVLEFEPREAGFLSLELVVAVTGGSNVRTDNDRLATTVAVDEPLKALYLGQRMVGGRERLAELVGAGFQIDPWNGEALTRESLAAHDLCVLDDLPREELGAGSLRALADAVESDGLGLFASGGKAAFGPGGFHDTPLAEVLPVEFVQKEEKRDPSTTLVVIIDTSGSMGGNRVQLAKEVARLAIRRLLPHDKVGMVEFYGAKRWAAPIQPASNSIEIERALNRLDAGGGTVILPAIEEAFYGLKNVQTRYKHVLILTDGGVETGAFEPLLRRMAGDGINTSTVLIGPEAHSEFLVTLANWGKGRFYSVPNRFNLPEILLKQPASSKLPAYRPGVHVLEARGGSSWWGDVDLAPVPELAGYVETRERPGAQILLETAEGSHPVLGSWRYGLGRVTAFTSEPTGPGTEPWNDWPGFGTWLARVLERTASDLRRPYRYELVRRGRELVLSAERRSPTADAPRARRVDGGAEQTLEFRRRAADRFEARLFAAPEVEVRIIAEASAAGATALGGVRTNLVSPALQDVAGEHNIAPADALDLFALSSATGGHYAPLTEASGFLPSAAGGVRPLSLRLFWPWFALGAILAYLAELYYRRRPGRRVVTS